MALAVPPPRNEPVLDYAPGSPERGAIRRALEELRRAAPRTLPLHIGGEDQDGGGAPFEVRAPHDHALLLGLGTEATPAEVRRAVDAALAAAPAWADLPLTERAAVLLRAADLLAGPWRARVNAATMMGQSKTVHQAEIDAACELADFWRFNVSLAARLEDDQPLSPPGSWNRLEMRPLEGFVIAITPFNFTSIAGNLPTAPALLGNTVVWKPSPTQQLAASALMDLLVTAGMPPGVINMVTGGGDAVSEVALPHPQLAGVHFTGSTGTFQNLWARVAANLGTYRTYPRLVGETGGKDFVLAHRSASLEALLTALVRGAFDYQGQKCSAVSRAYIPAELWHDLRGPLVAATESIGMGDVADLRVFMGAVIDERAYRRQEQAIASLNGDASARVIAGGECDAGAGWFVRPTVVETLDPGHDLMRRELFGPILAVHPYDGEWSDVLALVDRTSPYGLTGAVFATDRAAVASATGALRQAAGNLYINDKPTGAVVGQQPFGGARASGTNDKAGSALNLLRWVSPRIIKETFVPPIKWHYPHQDPD